MSLLPPRSLTLYAKNGSKFKIACSNEKTTLTDPNCVEINELCLPDLGNINDLLTELVASVNTIQQTLDSLNIEQLNRLTDKMHVDDSGNLLVEDSIYTVPTLPARVTPGEKVRKGKSKV